MQAILVTVLIGILMYANQTFNDTKMTRIVTNLVLAFMYFVWVWLIYFSR